MHSYLLSEPFDGTLEVSNPKPHTATNPDQVSEIKSLVIEKKVCLTYAVDILHSRAQFAAIHS